VTSADVVLRRATVADAEPLAHGVVTGVEDYPSFAPGWRGPTMAAEVAHLQAELAKEHVHCIVAVQDGRVAGQITVLPAAQAPHPVRDPGLAHVSNLFVRKDHWGSGLARRLHAAAVEHARDQGYQQLRLYVAEGQARARRFYEREGWRPVGPPFDDPGPGLPMVEYRLDVR
jgi:GNAT superfamily N-acetyltransferase